MVTRLEKLLALVTVAALPLGAVACSSGRAPAEFVIGVNCEDAPGDNSTPQVEALGFVAPYGALAVRCMDSGQPVDVIGIGQQTDTKGGTYTQLVTVTTSEGSVIDAPPSLETRIIPGVAIDPSTRTIDLSQIDPEINYGLIQPRNNTSIADYQVG